VGLLVALTDAEGDRQELLHPNKFLPILGQPLPAEVALTSQLRGKDHDQR